MAEYAAEDWSLQAIVRESSDDFKKMVNIDHMDGQDSFFENTEFNRDFFASFPELFDVSNSFSDDLEEMYKPFYPVEEVLVPVKDVFDFQERRAENVFGDEQNHHDKKIDHQSLGTDCVALKNPAYTPKYKKRKNHHKRVTIQVYAEGLSSDMWAWRKYGQKPIKGSPYPRSYYRCSSSKGCLARKQVEQNCTDPGMFIITYTAEHNHSQPTRRNSLAGTVRQKFPSTKNPIKQEKTIDESNTSTAGSSKSTPHREMNFPRLKQEIKDDDIISDSVMSEFVFNDDFFSGLEDFDEFFPRKYCPNAMLRDSSFL